MLPLLLVAHTPILAFDYVRYFPCSGLSAEGLSTITAIIDQVRKLEGLPPGTTK